MTHGPRREEHLDAVPARRIRRGELVLVEPEDDLCEIIEDWLCTKSRLFFWAHDTVSRWRGSGVRCRCPGPRGKACRLRACFATSLQAIYKVVVAISQHIHERLYVALRREI